MSGEPLAGDIEEILALQGDAFGEVFLHIGLIYQKPLRPTFLELGEVDNSAEAPASGGRRYVQALSHSCVAGMRAPSSGICHLGAFRDPRSK